MSPTFVQVAVNAPAVSGVFDYAVPPSLTSQVAAGQLVTAPFGKQTVQGVVFRFVLAPSVPEVKSLLGILDPEPVLMPAQLDLAESISASTLSPLGAVVGLFLPPGLGQHSDSLFTLGAAGEDRRAKDEVAVAGPVEKRLIALLQAEGALRGRQIDRHFRNVDWRKTARAMVRTGILDVRSVLPPPRVRPKYARTVQLGAAPETISSGLPTLGRNADTQARRERVIRLLLRRPEAIPIQWVLAETRCTMLDIESLAERDLVVVRETEIWRDPLAARHSSEAMEVVRQPLTGEQAIAWREVEKGITALRAGHAVKPFLLQGVTGSGKTELYIRAAEEIIRLGRQATILVPEISLTPQTVQRFAARFPGQVGLLHSRLSDGERYDTWRRARDGKIHVVLGPRSALFAPFPRPGLIVLDECHDASYYQAEPPFYHAEAVARTYARLAGAILVLGSATPAVTQRYAADVGGASLLSLTKRIPQPLREETPGGLPTTSVVDMRAELRSGNTSIFSRALLDGLTASLQRKEQVILFLNRRGTATYVFCRTCGSSLRCPRCDIPLTLHTTEGARLLCHQCGYQRGVPDSCPACGASNIGAYGLGSERVEGEVKRYFPQARTLRWDSETTRQKDAHEIILAHFVAGRADILIGTQMLAKGLHFPRVTLVGIVMADMGLHLPDPFAAERVFQVLTHVAGRAGRGERGGRVVLQTYVPDHYAIRSASSQDVDGFYQQELEQRRRLGYPPFTRLVRLEYRSAVEADAEAAARRLASRLQARIQQGHGGPESGDLVPAEGIGSTHAIIGPVPCFFRRPGGQYRWQIVLRGGSPERLLDEPLSAGWRIEVDPISLL